MPTREEIAASKVIVIGTVSQVNGAAAFITPEAFLKGSVSAHDIVIEQGPAGCAPIPIGTGGHMLLMLGGDGPTLTWPLLDSPGSYALESGHAVSMNPANHQTVGNSPTQAVLVDHIRSITGQYAVPAQSNSEGASLNWLKVVVPVTVVVLIVFAIGLYLMKIWHRIDPT